MIRIARTERPKRLRLTSVVFYGPGGGREVPAAAAPHHLAAAPVRLRFATRPDRHQAQNTPHSPSRRARS